MGPYSTSLKVASGSRGIAATMSTTNTATNMASVPRMHGKAAINNSYSPEREYTGNRISEAQLRSNFQTTGSRSVGKSSTGARNMRPQASGIGNA